MPTTADWLILLIVLALWLTLARGHRELVRRTWTVRR